MKEKISEILKSKSFYIVFSILLAVGAWLLVVSSQNPKESRSIEVPITFVNTQVLEENDLVDNSATTLPTTVTVKVSGSEAFVDRLQPSDLYVEVDYSQVTGPGNITLEIQEPVCDTLGVSVDSYYPMNIECVYDKTVERYIDVEVEWNEDVTANGISIVSAIAEPSNILVTGYSMAVDQIASVRVNLADMGAEITKSGSVSLSCHFYNEAGAEITRDFAGEKVVVRYTTGKIVPVKYNLIGTPADGYYVASHLPSVTSVTLTGDTEAINSISSVNLSNVSIQGSNKNFVKSINLSDFLPEGVSAVGVSQVDISINIAKYSSKTFDVSKDRLKVTGESAEYIYDYVLSSDSLLLKGTESSLDKVTENSVSYSIDVTDLGIGTHDNVKITVTLPNGVTLDNEFTCKVTVTAPEEVQPVPTEEIVTEE